MSRRSWLPAAPVTRDLPRAQRVNLHLRLASALAEETTMRGQRMASRLLAMTLIMGLLVSVPLAGAPAAARQDEQLQIVCSVPGLNFPFFVHMVNIAEDKAAELDIEL